MKLLPITEPDPERSCGDCQACCVVLEIYPGNDRSALPLSRAFARCGFQKPGRCAIHPRHPEPCRAYHCMWRLGWGPEDARPDQLGVLVEGTAQGWLFVIETRPGGWHEPRAREVVEATRRAPNTPATAIHVTPWGGGPEDGWWDGPEPTREQILEAARDLQRRA